MSTLTNPANREIRDFILATAMTCDEGENFLSCCLNSFASFGRDCPRRNELDDLSEDDVNCLRWFRGGVSLGGGACDACCFLFFHACKVIGKASSLPTLFSIRYGMRVTFIR